MRQASWIVGTMLLVTGCGDGAVSGTKIGNPTATVQMRTTAWSSDENVATIPQAQALTTGVVVTRAILGIEEIRLIEALPDGTCPLSDDGPEIERAFTTDLIRGDDLVPITVAKATRFCQVRFKLEEGEDLVGSEHGTLLGEAEILVEGARQDGTPFELRSREIGDIRIGDGFTSFSFDQDEVRWNLAFDVARWFVNVDLDGGIPSGGTIRIDEDNNRGLLEQFEDAVERGANACEDDEGPADDDCRDPLLGEHPEDDDGTEA